LPPEPVMSREFHAHPIRGQIPVAQARPSHVSQESMPL